MGRNSKMNPDGLRRLLSGAVLAFLAGVALGCGDGDNNPAGPGPEPPPDVALIFDRAFAEPPESFDADLAELRRVLEGSDG